MPGGLTPLRVGSISYINSLPVDLGISSGKISLKAEIIRGVPADLNQMILRGAIDISPVSVFWYAQNQDKFLVIPDVSISSESGVQSVLLFSRKRISDLAGGVIAVSAEGRTTPALLEILCRKFYGFKPLLQVLPDKFKSLPPETSAVLLIGDDALTHRQKMSEQGFFVTDLAEEWRRLTGLGFVFALWVVRRVYFMENEAKTAEACRAILESKKWGLSHRREVIDEAARRVSLPKPELEKYFSCLSYDLSDALLKGMNLYLQYAREYGLLQNILPVERIQPAPVNHD